MLGAAWQATICDDEVDMSGVLHARRALRLERDDIMWPSRTAGSWILADVMDRIGTVGVRCSRLHEVRARKRENA